MSYESPLATRARARLDRPGGRPSNTSLSNQQLGLSIRQEQILLLAARGHRNKAIADKLGLSVNTVCTHLKHVFDRLQVNSRTEAAVRYIEFTMERKAL